MHVSDGILTRHRYPRHRSSWDRSLHYWPLLSTDHQSILFHIHARRGHSFLSFSSSSSISRIETQPSSGRGWWKQFRHRKDFNTSSDIIEASLDALVDLLSCPHMPVFKILQDINLAGSFWSILKPSVPVAVIGKPVLTEAGLEDLVPCFWPWEFVLSSVIQCLGWF